VGYSLFRSANGCSITTNSLLSERFRFSNELFIYFLGGGGKLST
jgi:hypothetical protein